MRDVWQEELALRAREGSLGHAYILSGPNEGAVEALGEKLAAALVCAGPAGGDKPCGLCRHCKKTRKGIHPDVIHCFPEEGKDYTVEQARALRGDAFVTPNEGDRKVYLIHRAQRLTLACQNALLKVLEEGPRYAAFLLLTDNGDALLETVRSRCAQVTLGGEGEPPGEKTLANADELAGLLLAGDRWALLKKCVPLEKWSREDTAALWEAARTALLQRADGGTRGRAVRIADGLGDMIRETRLNVNTGALWGRLYALAD